MFIWPHLQTKSQTNCAALIDTGRDTQAPQRWGKLEPDQMLKHRSDTTLAEILDAQFLQIFQGLSGVFACPSF